MAIRDHLFPTSVQEAVALLGNAAGKARLISGGTDLVVALRGKSVPFEILVDTGRIPGLDRIDKTGDIIRIGARVTMSKAEADPILRELATALSAGAAWVGGPQIRNRATVVGNVISAQPAADAAVPLFALEATLEVVSPEGIRHVPIDQSYREVGESAVDPSREMVVAITLLAHKDGEVSVYQRMMRRLALTLPVLNCAARVGSREGMFTGVRIALGPVGAKPLRVREAEDFLQGREINSENILRAAGIARQIASPRSSPHRGSSEYRKEMVSVIVKETLGAAVSRLRVGVAER
jgi:aerobic carbon-monoxide dehydrogenase medium subunit